MIILEGGVKNTSNIAFS